MVERDRAHALAARAAGGRVGQKVQHEAVLEDLQVGGLAGAGDERLAEGLARGVAVGMHDAVSVVAALAPQRQLALAVDVEPDAPLPHLADVLGGRRDD